MQKYIENQFDELSADVAELKTLAPTIAQVAEICTNAIRNWHKIIFCGNGGSAAQSQHLAAELVGRYKLERPAMNSISLTVDTSNLTAIGNDYGYDVVFSRQLEGVGQAGDVLIGLSTSGNSKNVVLAFEMAKKKADYALPVPADTSAHIQEMHIAIGHLICDLIERNIYG